MFQSDLFLDEEFSQELLDVYSELTELSVVLYTADSEKVIYSNKNWPEFCQEICKISELEKKCIMDYKTEKGTYQCYAGLWCYAQPVRVDGNLVGTFVVGHRRIKGREEDSKKVLKQTLSKHNVDDKGCKRLMDLLEDVDAVDKFDTNFFKKLSVIEQFLIREHRNAIIFKKEAASSAHEFLLPIQSIIADAANLFTEAEERSELKSIAEDVLQGVMKLYFIAETIRGAVLEERDEFGYEFRYVEIYSIIQDTIILFRKEAKNKGVAINNPVVRGDIPVSSIEVSEPHIKQVFFNLIHNAVKYSYASTDQSERYITVVCKSHKNFYCVEISNYGIGIELEEMSDGLIFEDGYRGKLARDRSRTGSGFGLGGVKRIIEAHNGYVEVESKQVGIGKKIDPHKTTVKVCIPFYQPRS